MDVLRVFVNELFYEIFNIHFYENYKRLSKKSFVLFIFHKKFLKVFYIQMPLASINKIL